ncbi:ABC transporter substrate-binding protein [Sphingobium sp. RAC03]|uniref:ABC transporter substrate-binding protein n=1 Tax=Sphingobium sp. RAC03 TaxID=1843368 RepID=UPI00083CF7AC|nr:ABC transporter substrate-binding protein [Sphingobium sp. RAC03]
MMILRSLALATCLLCLALPGAAAERGGAAPQRPQRIVSLNLCSDQLVLALADRGQIAGLTSNVRDPEMSAAAEAARGLPMLRGTSEEVLAARPDLVIGLPARGHPALAPFKRLPFRTLDLQSAENYASILASIRQVAQAVGHPARGEALIARMEADLARLPRPARAPVAAYYQRRGYLTGSGTLIDDLLVRTGVTNLATRLGKPALSQMSLEEMVASQPDYLIIESATQKVTDQGTEMLHHPALRSIPRIAIPQAWTVCGGPAYVQAAQAIARAVKPR